MTWKRGYIKNKKRKLDNKRKSGVYKFNCNDCDKFDIGKHLEI